MVQADAKLGVLMTDEKKNSDLDFTLLIMLESVERLTQPHKVAVRQDGEDGPEKATVFIPALLEQLNDAIGSSQSSTNRGGGLANTRSVIDAGALMLEDSIRGDLAELWHLVWPNKQRPIHLPTALQRWHVEFRRLVGDNKVEPSMAWGVAQLLGSWVKQIDSKFDPPVVIEVTRPCPSCDASHVFDFLEDRVCAVVIAWRKTFENSSASCRNCNKSWVGEIELRQLRWDIEDDTPKA